MEIEEFVKKSLDDIRKGVESSDSGSEGGYTLMGREITFDLAVTVTNSSTDSAKNSGGVKIAIASIGTDGRSEVASSSETTSRIKFSVYYR